MAQPSAQFDPHHLQEQVRAAVAEFLRDLQNPHATASLRQFGLNSRLEDDLGLGSLERAELISRIEHAVGVHLPDETLMNARTVEDLARIAAEATPLALESGPPPLITPVGIEQLSLSHPNLPGNISTLTEALHWRGHNQPDRIHIFLYESGDGPSRPIAYAELLRGAEAIATSLQSEGLEHGRTVAIMLPTCAEFFWSFFGVLLAGGIPVPMYPPVRRDRIEEYAGRQTGILQNSGAQFLLTSSGMEPLGRLLKAAVPSLRAVIAAKLHARGQAALNQQHEGRPRVFIPRDPQPDDLALIQYTSGSTSSPKGVMLTHANLLANIRAIGKAAEFRPDDFGVSWLPLYHDMGLIGAWLAPLCFGIPVAILSPIAFLMRPSRWLLAIHNHRGTLSPAPNFGYEMCIRKISAEEMQGVDLSCWRAALNGAEPVRKETVDRFARRFSSYGFRPEALIPVYGLAEASLGVCSPPFGSGTRTDRIAREPFQKEERAIPAAMDEPNPLQFVCVGPPLPGVEVQITSENGQILEERREGRLRFRSPAATQGYYRDAAATEALIGTDGWLDSGDLAYQADGEIYITGRAKDIIIKGGRNFTPQEIEEAAGRAIGVRPGCVVAFGILDERAGSEQLVIVAEMRPGANPGVVSSEVIAVVAAAIGIPPDVVHLLRPASLPKTSSGKLQRKETKRLYLSGDLGRKPLPPWLQSARILAKSVRAQAPQTAGRTLHRIPEIAYGLYVCGTFGVCLTALRVACSFTHTPRRASQWARLTGRTLLRASFVPLEIVNGNLLDDFQRTAPWIFAPNHSSYSDIVVLTALLPSEAKFIAKGEVLSMPLIGSMLAKAGHFAFNRAETSERISQANAATQALKNGQSVIIFPEGTFTAAPGIRPFQLGAFKAAIETGCPICPVACRGLRRFLPENRVLPRPSRVRISFGPLLWPREQNWSELIRLRDTTRKIISGQTGEPLL